ncbi:MAG: glycosyltransferase family 2 protein [Limosilactobacillus sp.]
MKTAIIVPIYNVEKYLCECINSILKQNNKNFELILVDDGSTDGSGQICDGYQKEKSGIPIKVIHKKNGGLVSAWKQGVSAMSNECTHILFIDPDDWISEGYLNFLQKEYLKCHADVIITSVTKVRNTSKELIRFPIPNGVYTSKNIQNVYAHFLNNNGFFTRGLPVNRWGKLIKKSLVIKNMHYVPNDVTFAEDLNLIFPIIISSSKIDIIQDSPETYYYRIRKDSMLRGYDKNMWNSVKKVYKKLMLISINSDISVLVQQVYKDYVGAIDLCYKNNLENTRGIKEALNFIDILRTDVMFNEALHYENLEHYSIIDKIIMSAINTKSKFSQFLFFCLLKEMKILRNTFSRA